MKRLRFGLLVVTTTLVLGGSWFLVLPADSSVTSDDGAYAYAASTLDDGSWDYDYWFAEADPEGDYFPLVLAGSTDGRYYPSTRYPLWTRALQVGEHRFGLAGLRVLPLLGLGVALAASVAIAAAVAGSQVRWPALALAASSPLVFNGLQLWAHAVAAGLVALVVLASLRIRAARAPSIGWLVLAPTCAALAAAIRADGLVFALAAGAALGIGGLLRRRQLEVLVALAVGLAAFGAFRSSAAAMTSIMGSSGGGGESLGSRGSLDPSGLARGFGETFLFDGGGPGVVLVVLTVAVTIGAVVLLRHGSTGVASALLGCVVGVQALRIVIGGDDLVHGLVGAWPVALLVLAEPMERRTVEERFLLLILALGATGIVLTQYDSGGGLNWGGRFLASALPLIAALVAATLVRVGASSVGAGEAPPGHVPRLRAVVAALAAVALVASLVADASNRLANDRLIDDVEAAPATVPVITSAPGLPRIAWRTYPDRDWLLLRSDDSRQQLRTALVEAGVERVALYGVRNVDVEAISGKLVDPDRDPFDLVIVEVTAPD